MRLIYVANARFPTQKAHGVQIASNLCEFSRQDVQVTLVVPDRANNLPTDKPFAYYDLPECGRVVRLWTLDWVNFFKPVGFYIQRITFAFSALLYLLGEPKDAIIYGRDELTFALIKLFSPSRRIFYEMHDYPDNSYVFWYSLLKRLDGVISTNDWKRSQITKDYGVDPEKVIVARNGIDFAKFDIPDTKQEYRRELGLPLDKVLLGYVGQVQTKGAGKGVEEIREAIEIVKKDNPSVELEIVSSVPHSLIPKYLKAFDILLMPFPDTKHYAYYMSPIKMFEYMASGRPIIATDLPSIREVLNDSNALLIESSRPEVIARGVKKLVGEPNLADELGRSARESARELTLEKRVGKILEFIHKVQANV